MEVRELFKNIHPFLLCSPWGGGVGGGGVRPREHFQIYVTGVGFRKCFLGANPKP